MCLHTTGYHTWPQSSVCHKLKTVKSYNHFRFTKSDDVFCKKTIDSEEVKQSLLEDGAVLSMKTELPPVSNSPRLPAQRQWYLFEQIQEFVSKLFQDTVFPKPLYEKTRKVILKVMRIVICLSWHWQFQTRGLPGQLFAIIHPVEGAGAVDTGLKRFNLSDTFCQNQTVLSINMTSKI